jgi:integrase/recombinase XerD
VKALLAVATPRQAAFIRFLWATGARVSELCGALLETAVHEGDTVRIRIRGKGNKERTIRITAVLYQQIRETFPNAARYVFETSTGHRYLESYVSHQIAGLGRRVLSRRISAHVLRHSFATRKVLSLPGKLDALSRYLGHSSVAITMNLYVHTAVDDSELFGLEDDAI